MWWPSMGLLGGDQDTVAELPSCVSKGRTPSTLPVHSHREEQIRRFCAMSQEEGSYWRANLLGSLYWGFSGCRTMNTFLLVMSHPAMAFLF